MRRRGLAWLAWALLVCSGPASAEYLPKGAPAAAGARNVVLIYNSLGHRNWQPKDFVPLLSYVDVMGVQHARMFDTLLVLMLTSESGRGFCPGFGSGPSNKVDWDNYMKARLFGGDAHLPRLQEAAAEVAGKSGHPDQKWKVILTIPYPDPAQRDFGVLRPSERSRDLASPTDRLAAAQWYVDSVAALWNRAGFHNLEFVGWYWVHETVTGTDRTFVPRVAGLVHGQGRRFFWIPWFRAAGYKTWRDYGFDVAFHQPNYFFSLDVPFSRLANAASDARQYGMGMEIELDERALTNPEFTTRYDDYLGEGVTRGYRDNAITAWYMGADTLVTAAFSTDPARRAIYDKTYRFIEASGWPGDANGDRYVDMHDVLLLLRIASGRAGAPVGETLGRSLDVTSDGAVDMRDALAVLRDLSGLHPALP